MASNEKFYVNSSGEKSEGRQMVESVYKELCQLASSNVIKSLSICLTYEPAEVEFHHQHLGILVEDDESTSLPKVPEEQKISITRYKYWVTDACETLKRLHGEHELPIDVYNIFREAFTMVYFKTPQDPDKKKTAATDVSQHGALTAEFINYEMYLLGLPYKLESKTAHSLNGAFRTSKHYLVRV